VRVVMQQKLPADLTATVAYNYGGVLDASPNRPWDEFASSIHTERRHAVTTKLAGSLPGTKTRWSTSYKWTSGTALTPVDMFDASPGQSEPYFNVFVRQPIPGATCLGRMEALVEVRNLLAQGYMPVVSPDGQTLYLVQSARSIRGGVAFTF
jgi:hypothetical protein